MKLRLGIDVACRAAHQATLADQTGALLWSGRRFHTSAAELARVWAWLPAGADPGLERYLRYDNTERAHTGRWTKGRTPEAVLGKAKLWHKHQ
jgi:hypothetical protein